MNILLVNPLFPDTFWGFRHALRFIARKGAFPPLGLLTVAAMLPKGWRKRLIDLNVQPLHERDLRCADLIFLTGMSIQEDSIRQVIARAHAAGKRVVAGGPIFTERFEEFAEVDHLVLNEAEITLPMFLDDLLAGKPKRLYITTAWADISRTPAPLWALADFRQYSSMNIQYSRGCPYDCEFCDITVLYGRRPRTKGREQFLAELDSLYHAGWRGDVFLVDDNFIGNKKKLKSEILPALIEWKRHRRHPFLLNTEASIDLSDDPELMSLMTRAGFNTVFVGIESPNEESLEECRKVPNRRRDLVSSVHRIQAHGLQVQGGFILGFDSDPGTIFQRTIEFIQQSGIVTAMVGLLNAPVGSRLYHRMKSEGRLLRTMTGDNTDISMNFVPKMNIEKLKEGYRTVLETIYAPGIYYARVKEFLRTYDPPKATAFRFHAMYIRALVRAAFVIGIVKRGRSHFWKLMAWSLFRRPRMFPMAVTFSIYGYHYRQVLEHYIKG